MADIPSIDLSTLDDESKRNLHHILYRQECRAWILWCVIGLGALGFTKEYTEHFSWEHEIINCFIIAYSCYISFWVVHPTQKLLKELRKNSDTKESWNIERKFDASWSSVRDMAYPILLPIFFYLLLPFLSII